MGDWSWYWFATQAQVWRGYKGQIIHGVSGRPSKLRAWLTTSISGLNGYAPKSLITGCFVAFACISSPTRSSFQHGPASVWDGRVPGLDPSTHHLIHRRNGKAQHESRRVSSVTTTTWSLSVRGGLSPAYRSNDEFKTGFEQQQWDFNHGCGSKLSTSINPKVLDGF